MHGDLKSDICFNSRQNSEFCIQCASHFEVCQRVSCKSSEMGSCRVSVCRSMLSRENGSALHFYALESVGTKQVWNRNI